MGQINAQMLKEEIWKYIDGDKIKALVGDVNDASWSPFRLDAAGQPIGFQKAVVENSGMFFEIIRAAAIAVEKVCYDLKGVALGGEKKKAVVDWLNSVIDIPWVPEAFEDNIIEFIIDKMISWLNLVIGKDWINKIPVPSITTIA